MTFDAREETSSRSFKSVPSEAAAVNAADSIGVSLPTGTSDGRTTVWDPKEAARTRGGVDMTSGSHTSTGVAVELWLSLRD